MIIPKRIFWSCNTLKYNQTSLSSIFFFFIIFASQESFDLATSQSQDASHLLPPPCSSPLLSSVEEHPQTEGPSTEKMDAHLLKKMAFRWITMVTKVSQDPPQSETYTTWWAVQKLCPCVTSYSLFFPLSFPPVPQEVSVSWRVGLRRSGRRQAGAAGWTSSTGGHGHAGLLWDACDRDAAQWKLRGPAPSYSCFTCTQPDPG